MTYEIGPAGLKPDGPSQKNIGTDVGSETAKPPLREALALPLLLVFEEILAQECDVSRGYFQDLTDKSVK